MSEILNGVEGVICQMDDVLAHGANQEQHDRRVRATLHRLQEAGNSTLKNASFSKLL